MKRTLLIILLIPNLLFAQRNTDFVVEIKNGFQYLNHIVKRGESIQDISNSYTVKVEVLENINHLNSNIAIKENQSLMIPLIETNFFKMLGITSSQNGFYPLYYKATENETLQSICAKFSVLPAAIKKWNHDNFDDAIQENEKIIVGWIKYKSPGTISETTKVSSSNQSISNTNVPSSSPTISDRSSEINSSSTVPQQAVNAPKTKESKINQFFAKIKASFKSKPESPSTSASAEKKNPPTEQKVVSSNTNSSTSVKKAWNNLVNGKDKSASPSQATKKAEPVATKSTAAKPAPKNNVLYDKSNQTKTNTTVTSTKTQVAPKPQNQYNTKSNNTSTPKPVVVKKAEAISNQTAQVSKSTSKKENVQRKVESSSEKAVKSSANTIKEEKKEVVEDQPVVVTKVEEPVIEKAPEVVKPLHNEGKALDLSESKSGKCAYFFSGPQSGRFYVFTNLAPKGEIIKVTNTVNNRFVMAEVVGNLPMSDVTKGLLIKLSDNAKLALAQNNNLFMVKVNY